MAELNCYNKGCGQKFTDAENNEDCCTFHPGGPVFHDAYKGWSCCKKRSTDFTDFLNMPGCTKGKHNPIKPDPPKKNIEKPLEEGEILTSGPVKQMKNKAPTVVTERPSNDIPKSRLKYSVANSLKTVLQKHQERMAAQRCNNENGDNDSIQKGACCKHHTCEAKYVDEDSNISECTYHPGSAVFHEGYKFWSCCQKRTSDFDQFLKQLGCESGEHDWMKPSEVAEKKSNCRYDWHQTGSSVLITIYAKVCDPEKCVIEANPTGIHANVAFNGGLNIFELDLILNEVIVPEESTVDFLGTKVEMKLKKKEAFSWPRLEV